MAQDFYAAFRVGEDDTHITTIGADGVALAAIQGLNALVQEKDARIAALEQQSAALEARIEALEKGARSGDDDTGRWNAVGLALAGTLVSAAVVYRKERQ